MATTAPPKGDAPKQQRRSFTAAQKTQAVRRVIAGKSSLSQTAAEMGIATSMIHRWKKEYETKGRAGLKPKRSGPKSHPTTNLRPSALTRSVALAMPARRPVAPAEMVPNEDVAVMLYASLGRLTVENQALRAENQALRRRLASRR